MTDTRVVSMQAAAVHSAHSQWWRAPLAEPRVPPAPAYKRTWLMRTLLWLARRRVDPDPKRRIDLNVFTTLGHEPGIFYPWLIFASRLMPYGKLDRMDTERIILRVGFRTGSLYEWVQHVRIGQAAGLSREEIDSLLLEDSPQWSERTRTLMRATDMLIARQVLDDSRWQAIRACLGERGCVEFCMLVGQYTMLAMMLNTLGVQIEAPYQDELARYTSKTPYA